MSPSTPSAELGTEVTVTLERGQNTKRLCVQEGEMGVMGNGKYIESTYYVRS